MTRREKIWHKRGDSMPKRKRLVKVTDLITEGLCRLVEKGEKPYSELTVQDIVDEAGVCRNSFYRNYAEKDDIFRKQFSEIISSPTDAEPPAHFDYFDIFRFSCRIFEQHQRFFRCFYRANPAVYFETIVGQIIRSNNPADSIEPRAYYLYAARAWTGVGLMTEWLLRGCDLEIDALTDVLKGFFSKR